MRADGGDSCSPAVSDLPPRSRIRFNLQSPASNDDYPYTEAVRPPDPVPPHSPVYLSATDSVDPEGAGITFFWNVQDPTGKYLGLDPDPSAPHASFLPSLIGPHTVTLEAVEAGGLHQIAQAMLTLQVAPRPCAADGFSPPCSDELAVPGGRFMAGSTDDVGEPNEHPRHPAVVAPFWMDRYEVTVGRFRRFVNAYTGADVPAGAGGHPLVAGSGWQPGWNGFRIALTECGGAWTDEIGSSEARPVSCVTWYEAFAFCIHEGKRLPTEAEWEYAAAGGDEQRIYPWGQEAPSRDRAVFGCQFDGQDGCSDADLPVVGSLPAGAGRWGHLDLAGSVLEWTFDVYAPYIGATCDNCAEVNVTEEDGRAFRGGEYSLPDPSALRTAARYGFDAKFPDYRRGFRCARSIAATGP